MLQVSRAKSPEEGGFSLIELLVVVGIIVVLAAVALPNIGNYVRNYRIRGAVEQVAGELQTARTKAIAKNVNLGVVFAVVSSTQYQYAVEDDLVNTAPPPAPHPWGTVAGEGGGNWATLLADAAQAGPLRTLPVGIQFDSPANCQNPAGGAGPAPNTWGLRFSRLGAACDFTALNGNCGQIPPNPPGYTNYVGFAQPNGTPAFICLWETTSNLRQAITVATGGRIRTQQ